jgi:hypothetical protein
MCSMSQLCGHVKEPSNLVIFSGFDANSSRRVKKVLIFDIYRQNVILWDYVSDRWKTKKIEGLQDIFAECEEQRFHEYWRPGQKSCRNMFSGNLKSYFVFIIGFMYYSLCK